MVAKLEVEVITTLSESKVKHVEQYSTSEQY